MNSTATNLQPRLNVRPGDFVRLRGWPLTAFYKVVVNANGITPKRARLMEAWGAFLGANMAHHVENGTNVNILGLGFKISGDATGKSCEIAKLEEI